eukprot:gene5630-7185_t
MTSMSAVNHCKVRTPHQAHASPGGTRVRTRQSAALDQSTCMPSPENTRSVVNEIALSKSPSPAGLQYPLLSMEWLSSPAPPISAKSLADAPPSAEGSAVGKATRSPDRCESNISGLGHGHLDLEFGSRENGDGSELMVVGSDTVVEADFENGAFCMSPRVIGGLAATLDVVDSLTYGGPDIGEGVSGSFDLCEDLVCRSDNSSLRRFKICSTSIRTVTKDNDLITGEGSEGKSLRGAGTSFSSEGRAEWTKNTFVTSAEIRAIIADQSRRQFDGSRQATKGKRRRVAAGSRCASGGGRSYPEGDEDCGKIEVDSFLCGDIDVEGHGDGEGRDGESITRPVTRSRRSVGGSCEAEGERGSGGRGDLDKTESSGDVGGAGILPSSDSIAGGMGATKESPSPLGVGAS